MTQSQLQKVNTESDCNIQGGQWSNAFSNFDNVFNAMLTLFQLISTEGWIDIMNNGIDSTDIGQQPQTNSKIEM